MEMTKYWCANLDSPACLEHGIDNDLWLMQYQFADEKHDHIHQGYKKPQISLNWNRMKAISPDDWFVAYLPRKRAANRNPFYAVGQVGKPRRPQTADDPVKTVAEYLRQQRSHEHRTGYVYYDAPVFYEDFADKWRDPDDGISRYAQRIDVKQWQHYAPDGVWVEGLGSIPRNETVHAVFEVSHDYFNAIKKKLMTVQAVQEDESVLDALESSHAKSQGFQLDSKVRKALDEYAMNAAKTFFSEKGYAVEDRSKTQPYDLHCVGKKGVLYVEVKGTKTAGGGVLLTAGEVRFARDHQGQMVLFVLHSISVEEGGNVLAGGDVRLIQPWDVNKGSLNPTHFMYDVPT